MLLLLCVALPRVLPYSSFCLLFCCFQSLLLSSVPPIPSIVTQWLTYKSSRGVVESRWCTGTMECRPTSRHSLFLDAQQTTWSTMFYIRSSLDPLPPWHTIIDTNRDKYIIDSSLSLPSLLKLASRSISVK